MRWSIKKNIKGGKQLFGRAHVVCFPTSLERFVNVLYFTGTQWVTRPPPAQVIMTTSSSS